MTNAARRQLYVGILSYRLRHLGGSLADVMVLWGLREGGDGACLICDGAGTIQQGYLAGLDCVCQDSTGDRAVALESEADV